MARKKTPKIIKFPTVQPDQSETPLLRDLLCEAMANDDDPIDFCQDIYDRMDDPGRALVDLVASESDPDLVSGGLFLLKEIFTSDAVPEFAREHFRQGTQPAIRTALRNATLDDQTKIMLAAVYALADPHDHSIQQCLMQNLKDPQGAREANTESLRKSLQPTPVALASFFIHTGILPNHNDTNLDFGDHYETHIPKLLDLVLELLPIAPEGAAAVACVVASNLISKGWPQADMLSLLDSIRDHPYPSVAWYLRELAALPNAGQLGIKAKAYAAGMERDGVAPQCPGRYTFTKGTVTQYDNVGSCSIHLLLKNPDTRKYDFVALLINDKQGLKDVWFVSDQGRSFLKEIAGMSPPEITAYPCTLEFARQKLNEALQINRQSGHPIPGIYLMCRPYLGAAPISEAGPCRLDLDGYGLDDDTFQPQLVQQSHKIADISGYSHHFCSDQAFDFIRYHAPRRGRARLNAAKTALFYQEVVSQELDLILARMEWMLHLEARNRRHTLKRNIIAAHTWYALKHDRIPPDQVPYIRHCADLSIPDLIDNIRAGLYSQAQVTQAQNLQDALEEPDMDEMADFLIQELGLDESDLPALQDNDDQEDDDDPILPF